MSDSTDGGREASEGVTFQIRDSVVAYTHPLTEGLIVVRTFFDEGRLDLTLIVDPHKKKGHSWSRTAVISRDAARLSKKTPAKFAYPIRDVEQLRVEAKKAKADPAWVFSTIVMLDRDFGHDEHESGESDLEEQEEEEPPNLSKKSASASRRMIEEGNTKKKFDDLEHRLDVVQLKNTWKGKKREIEGSAGSKSESEKKKRRKRKSAKKKRLKSSSDSSSSSSTSSSDEWTAPGEVGEKGNTGLLSCPFHLSDSRGFKDVNCQIKGQSVTRKYIRIALNNLYAEHHTLTTFADSLITKRNASSFKPFSTDTAWFQAYAKNIDSILLNSLERPWVLRNEPCLDEMVMDFLELIIRVSPYKEYPSCLDDSVRKWMKKKRIGTNTKYGPVSYAMQHAKFTDSSLILFQAEKQKSKERPFNKSRTPTITTKAEATTTQGGDKKPSHTSQP